MLLHYNLTICGYNIKYSLPLYLIQTERPPAAEVIRVHYSLAEVRKAVHDKVKLPWVEMVDGDPAKDPAKVQPHDMGPDKRIMGEGHIWAALPVQAYL